MFSWSRASIGWTVLSRPNPRLALVMNIMGNLSFPEWRIATTEMYLGWARLFVSRSKLLPVVVVLTVWTSDGRFVWFVLVV